MKLHPALLACNMSAIFRFLTSKERSSDLRDNVHIHKLAHDCPLQSRLTPHRLGIDILPYPVLTTGLRWNTSAGSKTAAACTSTAHVDWVAMRVDSKTCMEQGHGMLRMTIKGHVLMS